MIEQPKNNNDFLQPQQQPNHIPLTITNTPTNTSTNNLHQNIEFPKSYSNTKYQYALNKIMHKIESNKKIQKPKINKTKSQDNKKTKQLEHIKLASHNIQEAFNQNKSLIIQQMYMEKISLLFICEINLINSNSNLANHNATKTITLPEDNDNPEKMTKYIICHNPAPIHRGSRYALIIEESLYKHLQSLKIVLQGRAIESTFSFKNNTKLQILSIYIPASGFKPNAKETNTKTDWKDYQFLL